MEQERIYLAAPYTHQQKPVQVYRYEMATRAAAKLTAKGHIVYSPLTHGHSLAVRQNLSGDFDFWQAHCLSFLDKWATKMVVLTLEGYEESKGVKAEIAHAKKLGITIQKISPETLGLKV